jgi:hypothetical protein
MISKEQFIVFCPKDAERFGITESIIIQQIHSLSTDYSRSTLFNGERWFVCSFTDWASILSFIPEPTVKRNILALEKLGVVLSCEPYKKEGDRTKGYRINYDAHQKLLADS